MRGWTTGTTYSKHTVTRHVHCWRQPLWAYLRAQLFHRTLCRWFAGWTRRTGGWPDLMCFELTHARREVEHTFELSVDEK